MSSSAERAYFGRLNYSLGDEDPTPEASMARDIRAKRITCIAGSGIRVLALAGNGPASLKIVDLSSMQLAITKTRVATLLQLTNEDYAAFWGYQAGMSAEQRKQALTRLQLEPEVRAAITKALSGQGWHKPYLSGSFERMLKGMSLAFRTICGRSISRLYECKSLEEQQNYLSAGFSWSRWNRCVRLLAQPLILNALQYNGALPKPDPPLTWPEYVSCSLRALLQTVYCRDSFFLQLLTLGELRYPNSVPWEYDAAYLDAARQGLQRCAIVYHHADILELDERELNQSDLAVLSDVLSFTAIGPKSLAQLVMKLVRRGGIVSVRCSVKDLPVNAVGQLGVTVTRHDLAERTALWQQFSLRRDT